MGDAVGLGVGDEVFWQASGIEGVGSREGFRNGLTFGIDVGSLDGFGVGFGVGLAVGIGVGALDGFDVGFEDGLAVGIGVGSLDGFEVGSEGCFLDGSPVLMVP